MRAALLLAACCAVHAVQPAPRAAPSSRAPARPVVQSTRRGLAAASSALLAAALAERASAASSVFESTCLGFGCNNYRGQDFGGMAAPPDEPSTPFPQFIKTLENAETRSTVENVDIYGADGSIVYVTYKGGKRERLGEGLPVEDDDGWSSYLWLVRILKNTGVPYTYHFRPGDKPARLSASAGN